MKPDLGLDGQHTNRRTNIQTRNLIFPPVELTEERGPWYNIQLAGLIPIKDKLTIYYRAETIKGKSLKKPLK